MPSQCPLSNISPSVATVLQRFMAEIQSAHERNVQEAINSSTEVLTKSKKKSEKELFVMWEETVKKQSTIEELQKALVDKQFIIDEKERKIAEMENLYEGHFNIFKKRIRL